jgi:cell division septum initiation protein DivIVA
MYIDDLGGSAFNIVQHLLSKYQQEKTVNTVEELQQQIEALKQPLAYSSDLSHLHPAIQQIAGSLFATNHHPQAIQSACTALEKAIQQKSGQSASMTGTALIGKSSPKTIH